MEETTVMIVGAGLAGVAASACLNHLNISNIVHILTKEIVWVSMFLLKYLSLEAVEELNNGNLSKHGIKRPKQGPFLLKATRGRSATIDVGCVFPSIKNIQGKHVEFINENVRKFDAILFATGYKRENGIYCTGFARQGLMSITNDAKKIAEDINFLLNKNKRNNWIRCD
ncbi:hypothetical protein ACOSP7_009703 [Xanthoceras sorbifolium]